MERERMATDLEREGTMVRDGSDKPSSPLPPSSFTLPSRRTYFLTVSSIAFVAGIGVGVVAAIRSSRRMRLEGLRAAQEQNAALYIQNASKRNNVVNRVSSTTDEALTRPEGGQDDASFDQASSKGPFALFREMNRAAYARMRQCPASPAAERRLSSSPSVFDAQGSAPPPSVLMRSAKQAAAKEKDDDAVVSKNTLREQPEDEGVPLGQQPGILAFKALGIATALVGVFAWTGVEVAYRVLGVKNRDELIEQLGNIIPASERGSQWLGPIGERARRALGGTFDDPKKEKEEDVLIIDAHGEVDLDDVDGTLDQLESAVERGDTLGWFDVLSRRLNAERRQDLDDRRKRIEAATALQNEQSI